MAAGTGGRAVTVVDRWSAEVEASYSAAADRGVSVDRLSMAGTVVELRFASEALQQRLGPAFAHLTDSSERGATGLTVHLWDSATTNVSPPPRPTVPEDHAQGAIYHMDEPPVRAAYLPGIETLSVLDSATRVAWHWVRDATEQPYWEQACPIRQILFWWLRSRSYLQVHGAAVGTPTAGVLVVGGAGSGKSTVALSSLGSDLLYAGDDYVAVTAEPEPRLQSLYNTGKLEPDHVHELLPDLLPLLSNADRLKSEKAVIYVHRHFPGQTTSGFPLSAVLVPRVRTGQRESAIVETSRAAALTALAPSTIIQLHTADPLVFRGMSELIELMPCYELELGSDVTTIPGVIQEFLARLSCDS
jgi:hypothetical protein